MRGGGKGAQNKGTMLQAQKKKTDIIIAKILKRNTHLKHQWALVLKQKRQNRSKEMEKYVSKKPFPLSLFSLFLFLRARKFPPPKKKTLLLS